MGREASPGFPGWLWYVVSFTDNQKCKPTLEFLPISWDRLTHVQLCVHMNTSPCSVFKVLVWIFAITIKICTHENSSQALAWGFIEHSSRRKITRPFTCLFWIKYLRNKSRDCWERVFVPHIHQWNAEPSITWNTGYTFCRWLPGLPLDYISPCMIWPSYERICTCSPTMGTGLGWGYLRYMVLC